MNKKIDRIDRHILNILQNDVSVGMDTLAEKVNLSRNACWRRVKRMQQDGIIRAQVALLNADLVGLGLQAFVMIRTNEHDPVWLNQFAKAVQNIPEITSAHRMSGDLDYVLRVRLNNVNDYDRFYQKLITQVPIADISASFVMDDIKDTTALPV